MALSYPSIVTDGLSKQIATKIREAIVSGQLKVDERLPSEDELAARFGVSRPTVREALKRLAAQNLIRSRRGPTGGTFVARPTQSDITDALASATTLLTSIGEFDLSEIIEARQELEKVCSRLAAERRSDADLEAMAEELSVQCSTTLTDEEFCASDVRFHHAIVEATQNPLLRLVMGGFMGALQPVANMVVFQFRERKRIIEQHERLYEAIRDKNVDEAMVVIDDQMNYLRTIYARAQAWRQGRDSR